MEFNGQKIKFVEKTQVKEGVSCDVFEFENDTTRDLGLVKVLKGFKTPLQKVISGDKTIEIYQEGVGHLTVIGTDKKDHVYNFPGQQSEVEVYVGETMQWEAIEDLTIYKNSLTISVFRLSTKMIFKGRLLGEFGKITVLYMLLLVR
jgi:hypothetical protein